jgi:hypothetical protein
LGTSSDEEDLNDRGDNQGLNTNRGEQQQMKIKKKLANAARSP